MKVVALNTLGYAKSTPGYVYFTRHWMNYRPAKKILWPYKVEKMFYFCD